MSANYMQEAMLNSNRFINFTSYRRENFVRRKAVKFALSLLFLLKNKKRLTRKMIARYNLNGNIS